MHIFLLGHFARKELSWPYFLSDLAQNFLLPASTILDFISKQSKKISYNYQRNYLLSRAMHEIGALALADTYCMGLASLYSLAETTSEEFSL